MRDPEVEIMNLSADRLDAAAPLLAASAFKPLRFLAGELGSGLTDFWSRSIADVLRAPSARGFLALRGDKPLGLLVYADNPWETDLIGRKAAVIHAFLADDSSPDRLQLALSLLDHALPHAAANGVQFMLGKTYTDDMAVIHALSSRGFLLMDTILDCHYDYRRVPFENLPAPVLAQGVTLRPAAASDRDELVALAGAAFLEHFGRFHADERLGRSLATRAYEKWMVSSLDGYADWIHLARAEGRIVGFSIWKRPSPAESRLNVRVGHYSIAGIHPGHHGRGLFTALTYAGMESLRGVADLLEGPTHVNNHGVQRGYLKLGWRVGSDARHSFHKWMD
jgi:hypothetical protein